MNLFASFILKAVAVLAKDVIFDSSYSKRPDSEKAWLSYVSEVCPSRPTLPPGGSVLGVRGRKVGLGREEREKGCHVLFLHRMHWS